MVKVSQKFRPKVMRDWRVIKEGGTWEDMEIVHADCMRMALELAVNGKGRKATKEEIEGVLDEEEIV